SEDQAACKRIAMQFSNACEIQIRCRHSKYSHPRCRPHMATISKQQMAEVTQMIPPICIQFPNCNTRSCVLGTKETFSKIGNKSRRARLLSRPWGLTALRWRTCRAGHFTRAWRQAGYLRRSKFGTNRFGLLVIGPWGLFRCLEKADGT